MPPLIAAAAIAAGAGISTGVIASRAQSGASKRATVVQSKSDDAALALERERDAEARLQWDADQQQRAKEFAASEEDRAFTRQNAEFQQQLLREREQRAVPYRQMSQQALGNLGSLLGLDMSGGGPLRHGGQMGPAGPPVPPTPGPQGHTMGNMIQLQRRA